LISSGRLSYRWLFAIAIAIAVEVEGEASYVVLDHHDVTRGASSSGDFLYSLHQWVSAVALAPIGMADLYLNAVGSFCCRKIYGKASEPARPQPL